MSWLPQDYDPDWGDIMLSWGTPLICLIFMMGNIILVDCYLHEVLG